MKLFRSDKFTRLNRNMNNLVHVFVDYLLIIFAVFFNLFFKGVFYKKQVKIVTAVSSEFFESVIQFIENINKFSPTSEIVIYDLGMTTSENDSIKNSYEFIKLKKFDFNKYPKFFSEIDEFGKLGQYAWKSSIIKNEIENTSKLVFWFDSGNLISNKLTFLKIVTTCYGLFSPYSNGRIENWTHKSTLNKFDCEKKILKKRNRTGGIICINPEKVIAKNLILNWQKFSTNQEYIAPEGSNRQNHRQDQSLLSILMNLRNSFILSPRTKTAFGLKVNQNPMKHLYITDSYNDIERSDIKNMWIKSNSYVTNTIKNAQTIWILNFLDSSRINKKYINKCKLIISFFNDDVLYKKELKIILNNYSKDKNNVVLISENHQKKNEIQEIFKDFDIEIFQSTEDLNGKVTKLI